MILNSHYIRQLIEQEQLIQRYINLDTQIQPNGFDLTINIESIKEVGMDDAVIDFDNSLRKLPETIDYFDCKIDRYDIHLPIGQYLFQFNEYVNLPSWLMAECKPRSTMLRSFCDVRNAFWDRGFHGLSSGLLIVYNPLIVYRNARIAQMKFQTVDDDKNVYDGIYKN